MEVRVSNLRKLKQDLLDFQPTHVISVLDPDFAERQHLEFTAGIPVLRAHFFDDDDLTKQRGAVDAYVEDILRFLRDEVLSTPSARLLVHCHAGASRSPAIAFAAYCLTMEAEHLAFGAMLNICNKPWPSENVVGIVDRMLERDGRMIEALRCYADRYPRRYQAYQRLNRRRDLFAC